MGRGANVQSEENTKDEAIGPHQACIADPWPCIFVSEWFSLSQFGAVYLYRSMIFVILVCVRLTARQLVNKLKGKL